RRNKGAWPRRPSAIESPAVSIPPSEQIVPFLTVGHPPHRTVVGNLPAGAIGHQSQKHRLDQLAAVIKIAGGFQASLTRLDPLAEEITHGWNELFLRAGRVVRHV